MKSGVIRDMRKQAKKKQEKKQAAKDIIKNPMEEYYLLEKP